MKETTSGGFIPSWHWRYQRDRFRFGFYIGCLTLVATPVVVVIVSMQPHEMVSDGLRIAVIPTIVGGLNIVFGLVVSRYYAKKVRQELGLWLAAKYGVRFTDDEVRQLEKGEEVLRDGRYWAVHINPAREGFKLDSEPQEAD